MKFTFIAIIISAIYWLIFKPLFSKNKKNRKAYKEIMSRRSDIYFRKNNWEGWRYLKVEELPTLDAEKFKNYYNVNPDSWHLEMGIAYKRGDGARHGWISAIAFRPYSNFLKYEKFRKEIEDERTKRNLDAADLEVRKTQDQLLTIAIESIQKDIDDLRNQALKEYEEAIDTAMAVTARMTTERKEG